MSRMIIMKRKIENEKGESKILINFCRISIIIEIHQRILEYFTEWPFFELIYII